MTYIIAFELYSPIRDYTKFYEAIKACGEIFQALKNVIIVKVANVKTIPNVDVFATYLSHYLDSSDKLLIYSITGKRPNGMMTNEAWSWLNLHVDR